MTQDDSQPAKISTGLIIGLFLGIATAIVVVAVVFMNIVDNTPIVGKYILYSTVKDQDESIDTVAMTQSLGIDMSVEFRQDGTGQISTFASGSDGEASFNNGTLNFTWGNGKINIDKTQSETESPMNLLTNYKLIDNDYIVISGEESGFEVKFRRLQ